MTEQKLRNLKISAVFSACAHTVGAFAMAFLLAPGLDTNPDVKERILYIFSNSQVWKLGWASWMVSAVSFLIFTYYFYRFHLASPDSNKKLLLAALGTVSIAVLADLIFESREMFYLTDLVQDSRNTNIERVFLLNHQIFMVGSGIIANLLYCLSTLFSVMTTRSAYPIWVQCLGFGVFIFGVAASIFCYTGIVSGMFWSNAFLIPMIVFWQLGVAVRSASKNSDSVENNGVENVQKN